MTPDIFSNLTQYVDALPPLLLRRLRTIAEIAARAGGATALRYVGNHMTVELKADRSEVSVADHAAQQRVIEVIRRFRLRDPIIGEEGDFAPHDRGQNSPETTDDAGDERTLPPDGQLPAGPIYWVVDPIDGTRNFIRGLPGFGCAIAAMYAGFPIAAATFDSYAGRVYSTSWRDPLLIDDWPFELPTGGWRADPRVKPVLGVPSGAEGRPREMVHQWIDQHLVRNYGAAALHMAYVASGGLDATLNADTRLWDIAGGCLLVLRSGGVVTTLDGSPLFPLDVAGYRGGVVQCLASRNAELHRQLLRSDC